MEPSSIYYREVEMKIKEKDTRAIGVHPPKAARVGEEVRYVDPNLVHSSNL